MTDRSRFKKVVRIVARTILSLLFIVLFVYFLYSERAEILSLGDILGQGKPLYVIFGIMLAASYIMLQSLFYRETLRIIGRSLPYSKALSLFLRRFFIGSFLPAGFTVSQFAFTDELKPYKITPLENHMASITFLLMSGMSFLFLLIPALAYLMMINQLSQAAWYAALAVMAIILIAGTEFFLLFSKQRGVSYIVAKRLIPDLHEFMTDWQSRKINKPALYRAMGYTVGVDMIGIALVLVTLKALGLAAPLWFGAIAYVLTIIILTASPIFQGIGLVELSFTYILMQFDYTRHQAVATTLLYRFFQLWLPFFVGLALMLIYRAKHHGERLMGTYFKV